MPLKTEQQESAGILNLKLGGELDTETAPQLAPLIDALQESPPDVLVLNLKDLHYISSAGLRYVFQMKKLMKAHGGQFVISEPSPQVRKVFDIVKAVPVQSVFASTQELDEYLDRMQKQVTSGSD
jgi:sigma-B regulation protein RsbU (phosphoserine phosphatase)